MKKVLLKIDGMTCSACSSGLEKYLNKQEGIKASVNLVMNNASIEYDEKKYGIKDLEKFVSKAGFESLGIDKLDKEEKKKSNEKYKMVGITVISLLILYISMSHMVGLLVIPFLDMMEYPVNYAIALWILATIVIFFEKNILKNGIKNLIHKTPNMDTLVSIGVISSYFYSIYETIMILKGNTNYVHSLYFESAAIVLFFIKIGKYIENKNIDKTKKAIQDLMKITPKNAVIERDGKVIIVTIDEIQKGDIVVCKPGEKIAVDGTVIDGTTHINESFITGESVPVKREVGSKVIAGSINYEGAIKYKAEKIGKESTVSEIVRMVVEATNTKAPIAKIADNISSFFVPIVMLLAIVSFVVWMIITKDVGIAINTLVSVLVVACPCSLGLATPLAVVAASGVASKNGILIKNSEALENAHKIRTIVFDKTGTLTKGEILVSKIYNYSDLTNEEIMEDVALIEKKSEHPIAKAIVKYAEENSMTQKNISIKDFKAIPGYGVIAILNEIKYLIGNKELIKKNGINCIEEENIENGESKVFVAKEDMLIAIITLKDKVKSNAKETIKKLKEKNIRTIMLTGDNKETAKIVADEIEIDEIIANVKPKDKAEKIRELKQDGLVAMCGDGINDSISLVTADIGISISTGTDIAIDSSSVVIMNDNLDKINDLFLISKKTIRNIKQNLFWAFFYNICMIPIAMGIFTKLGVTMNPMFAAFAMTISSLTVVINALRLRKM